MMHTRYMMTCATLLVAFAGLGCTATQSQLMAGEGYTVTSPQLQGAYIDVAASRLDWRALDFAEGDYYLLTVA
jgi:hypothetical protein